MLNLLVTFDHNDQTRGEYFLASQADLVSKIANIDLVFPKLLNSISCQDNSIDYYIRQYNGNKFVFIGYLHGSEDALFIREVEYVNLSNAYLFSQSLFYACSCYAAKNLGNILLQNGCRVFLGFSAKITTCTNEIEPIFYECENAFISHFLTSDNTIQNCLKFMYDKYQERIRFLVSNSFGFDASILEENLSAFEILCNKEDLELTRRDFFS